MHLPQPVRVAVHAREGGLEYRKEHRPEFCRQFAAGIPNAAPSAEAGELHLTEQTRAHAQSLRDEALALYHQGRYAEATEIARRQLDSELSPTFHTILIASAVATGDTASARSTLAEMPKADMPPLSLGVSYAALDDVDAAFESLLRKELVWPPGSVVWLRHWFPKILRPIRSDPRYPELVRQIERKWKLEPDGSFGGLPE